jgi:hypothetical protein
MGWLLPKSEVVRDAGGWIWLVRGAGSRLALSDLGLFVQDAGHVAQVGWAAIVGVQAVPARGRWRIRIDDGYRPRTTRTTFDVPAARDWLALVTTEADRRQLALQVLPGGAGFTARQRP